MWIFLLAAAVFWTCCVLRERRCGVVRKAGAEAPAESGASVRERLEASRTAEVLGEVIDELRMVMEHPQLGGPGYLTVQFPPAASGWGLSHGQLPVSQHQRGPVERAVFCEQKRPD